MKKKIVAMITTVTYTYVQEKLIISSTFHTFFSSIIYRLLLLLLYRYVSSWAQKFFMLKLPKCYVLLVNFQMKKIILHIFFLCPNLFYWNKIRLDGSISIFVLVTGSYFQWLIWFTNRWLDFKYCLKMPSGCITECLTMLGRPIPIFQFQDVENLHILCYCFLIT